MKKTLLQLSGLHDTLMWRAYRLDSSENLHVGTNSASMRLLVCVWAWGEEQTINMFALIFLMPWEQTGFVLLVCLSLLSWTLFLTAAHMDILSLLASKLKFTFLQYTPALYCAHQEKLQRLLDWLYVKYAKLQNKYSISAARGVCTTIIL